MPVLLQGAMIRHDGFSKLHRATIIHGNTLLLPSFSPEGLDTLKDATSDFLNLEETSLE